MALVDKGSSYFSEDMAFAAFEGASHTMKQGIPSPADEDCDLVTTAQLKAMLAGLHENIVGDLATFKKAIERTAIKLVQPEATHSTHESQLTAVEKSLAALNQHQLRTESRIDALEDQRRRYNLKLRGV
ncbi:Hypothetical predicted protein [Pelobates cultripes]|uniref:Uncharacterized protein n=1 Tax=Pelobates cultripes TaxID=61616 RepID=A0AAD1WUZ5_PELCU|nr:Hypothetical predicted protein [Pelobates cultripes]